MWKNYFITAMRNITRNRTYSIINLLGLTLGLVSSMLIFQYVIYENSADMFHENVSNLYRVVYKTQNAGGTPQLNAQINLNAGQGFREEIPSIVNVSRVHADFFQECPTISGDEKWRTICIQGHQSHRGRLHLLRHVFVPAS
ncbi:MAG: hypothetical protein WDO15_24715, partial [Bacteroidota bacterium]